VKRAPLADYRIVCFSTHGLGAGDVKGLAEPSLVLSIPREPSDFDDGLLTSSEVAQLRLNADWVVLFACNSIAGDKPGAEALSGRARSFLRRRAGPSGIALVGGFGSGNPPCHGNRMKFDPKLCGAEALRQEMLAYLADATSPKNAYPAFGAPFALIGGRFQLNGTNCASHWCNLSDRSRPMVARTAENDQHSCAAASS